MTGTSSVQRWRAASVNPTIVTIAIRRATTVRVHRRRPGSWLRRPPHRRWPSTTVAGARPSASARLTSCHAPRSLAHASGSRTARPRSSPGRHSTTGTPCRRSVAIRSSNMSWARRRAPSGSCVPCSVNQSPVSQSMVSIAITATERPAPRRPIIIRIVRSRPSGLMAITSGAGGPGSAGSAGSRAGQRSMC